MLQLVLVDRGGLMYFRVDQGLLLSVLSLVKCLGYMLSDDVMLHSYSQDRVDHYANGYVLILIVVRQRQ